MALISGNFHHDALHSEGEMLLDSLTKWPLLSTRSIRPDGAEHWPIVFAKGIRWVSTKKPRFPRKTLFTSRRRRWC